MHRALGKQLSCVFVNNGVLRIGEAEQVLPCSASKWALPSISPTPRKNSSSKLKGVAEPEKKRKIIGDTFIQIFEQKAQELQKKRGQFDFLGQGTLYPDVIESVSVKGPSATIKSHHNVGGLPKRMKFKLVEPLRELFKDEVRELGKRLGIPTRSCGASPFPARAWPFA